MNAINTACRTARYNASEAICDMKIAMAERQFGQPRKGETLAQKAERLRNLREFKARAYEEFAQIVLAP